MENGRCLELLKQEMADAFLADASLFLEMFGIMVIGWQWLTMATAASQAFFQGSPKKKEKTFLEGKYVTAQYFFTYELPKIKGLEAALKKSCQMTFEMKDHCFTD
ncbi:MAG: acyl-CoA dehydrogenase C-terminal domain-containing protein [Desulfobacter sp.]|nr:acyl-CoA dehydrogenase C-terminal domain-containing protein [Desulfobacter sp.]WDP87706.1 MAG: acyl-CoA dehydrogenase C-terminal domain-containing protein [Desulfobacter sp.]